MTSGPAKRDTPKVQTPEASEPKGVPAKPVSDQALTDWYRPPGSGGTTVPEPTPVADSRAAREVEAMPAKRRAGRGQVVAVVAGKSGTGKSTIAANIACAIARDHRMTVAVVDLSLQFGDPALMFDAGSSPSMVDVLANIDALTPEFLLECMHQAHGLRILGAPPSPELADLVEAWHIRTIVDQLRLLFDFVVLDTTSHPRHLSL